MIILKIRMQLVYLFEPESNSNLIFYILNLQGQKVDILKKMLIKHHYYYY